MAFNSIVFFLFLFFVSTLYFLLPYRFRWALLLASSYYFYMSWNTTYALLILCSTITAYLTALLMECNKSIRMRRFYLCVSLIVNLGILFTFKYFNFLMGSLQGVLSCFLIPFKFPFLNVLLPVGISFYTFQTLSYTMDVYREKMKPEKHFGIFALYISFFPQLVAGPIERATHLLPQFFKKHSFDVKRILSGVKIIVWGLFKKVVVADTLAMYVDSVYNNPYQHTGPSFVVATYFFAFQIYCDFSGYSDIAIGSAKILGFDLMKNFNLPYFASNITDFWHRWHISLSTWLRDYLYIPLGGNQKGKKRTHINLLITMLLGGIWHGANWTFVIWGALHGLFLVVSKMTLSMQEKIVHRSGISGKTIQLFQIFLTFHIVCFAWIFFRANSVQDAFYIVSNLFTGWPYLFIRKVNMAYGMIGVIILLFVQILQCKGPLIPKIATLPIGCRWVVYAAVFFLIVLFGVDSGAQFIYFQF